MAMRVSGDFTVNPISRKHLNYAMPKNVIRLKENCQGFFLTAGGEKGEVRDFALFVQGG